MNNTCHNIITRRILEGISGHEAKNTKSIKQNRKPIDGKGQKNPEQSNLTDKRVWKIWNKCDFPNLSNINLSNLNFKVAINFTSSHIFIPYYFPNHHSLPQLPLFICVRNATTPSQLRRLYRHSVHVHTSIILYPSIELSSSFTFSLFLIVFYFLHSCTFLLEPWGCWGKFQLALLLCIYLLRRLQTTG